MPDALSPDEAPDDPLVGEFAALRTAVAEQVKVMARLEAALSSVQGEIARKAGPEQFKETFAALRADIAGMVQRLEEQEAAFQAMPGSAGIAAAVSSGMADMAQDVAQVRRSVWETASIARDAAEQGRDAAREAAGHARSARDAWRSDRLTLMLTLLVLLLIGGLGMGTGWGLRGWAAPPPAGVFARYLAAGNDPSWLLCAGGGKRFTTQNNMPACELRFWLRKAGP